MSGTQYDVSIDAGPYGEHPTGHLHLDGAYTFDAVPTCLNLSRNEVVAGFRITTGADAGRGFMYASGPSPYPTPPSVEPVNNPNLPNEVTTAADPGGGSSSASAGNPLAVLYSGVLTEPPSACPPPGASSPSFLSSAGGGQIDATAVSVQSGGPEHPVPWQQLTFADAAPATAIAQSSDGSMWFLEPSRNRIATLPNDASGRVTEFTAPTAAAGLGAIAPDASGMCDASGCSSAGMWFTETAVGRVGHITPDGHTTDYPTRGDPAGIAPDGPTGGAWFTEPAANRIGYVSPTGAVSEYGVPTAGARPTTITADDGSTGPAGDGAWFTEPGAGRIGYVSADGAIHEFRVNAGDPQAIVSDPAGGAVVPGGAAAVPANPSDSSSTGAEPQATGEGAWFTLPAADGLGHIDATGQIDIVSLPTPDAGLSGLATGPGPDGSSPGVWFSESHAGLLAYLSPSGDIKEFTVRGAAPAALALADPFGAPPLGGYPVSEAVWFTAADGSAVGAARFPETAGGYGVGGPVPTIVSPPSTSPASSVALSFKGWSVEVRIAARRGRGAEAAPS